MNEESKINLILKQKMIRPNSKNSSSGILNVGRIDDRISLTENRRKGIDR